VLAHRIDFVKIIRGKVKTHTSRTVELLFYTRHYFLIQLPCFHQSFCFVLFCSVLVLNDFNILKKVNQGSTPLLGQQREVVVYAHAL